MNEFEKRFFDAGARDAYEAKDITYATQSQRFAALKKGLGVLPNDPRGLYFTAYDTGVVFEINRRSGLALPVPSLNATERIYCVYCSGEDILFPTPGAAKDFAKRSGGKFYIASAVPEQSKTKLPSFEDRLRHALDRANAASHTHSMRTKETEFLR